MDYEDSLERLFEKVTYWHYAVWKFSEYPYVSPVCLSRYELLDEFDPIIKHGITLYRGDVTCPTCLKMMGPE